MTQAIIGNAAHPEYGVATIPFPIPRTEYANCVALLEALEIGDASDRDCQVQEICGSWPALKRLAQAVDWLSWDQRMKLGAVAAMAEPVNARQLRQLVENLDQFAFTPGVRSPEEYGRYLIRDAGHFAYDPNLEDFYDYEKYGLQRMAQETGCFTEQGYLSCPGEQSLEELLWEGMERKKPAEPEMRMGGW